ncbi:nucleotidyltransferase family protein [Salana multivorans]
MGDDVSDTQPMPIALDLDLIAEICSRHQVTRLKVFGSVLTDRFEPSRSDVDFLVEFDPDAERTFQALFALRDELERAVGHPVDLVDSRNLRNPYVARTIATTARDVYAA